MPDASTSTGASPSAAAAHAHRDAQLFRALFEQALDAVLITGDSGAYVDVNRAACELIGRPYEQIVGRPVQDFFDMGQTQSVEDAWDSFLEQGVMQGECRLRKPDGTVRHCSFRAKANFFPGLHMSMVRDITGRKETIEALHRSNRRLSFLSNVSHQLLTSGRPFELLKSIFADLSAELGLEVYFIYLLADNQRLRLDSCGGVPDDVVPQLEWLDLGQAVCGTVARERNERVIENAQMSADVMTEFIRGLGIQAYVCRPLMRGTDLIGTMSLGTRTRARFQPDELQFMHTVADGISSALERVQLISDLEANNSALQNANEELERSNADLSHFAYAVGHDLKEPLRTVSSFAQLLTRRLRDPDSEVEEFVSIINSAVERMNKFLEDLLRYAQIRSVGNRKRQPLDLTAILEWALMNLSSMVEESGATITHDALPEIHADQAQMVQLFQNLIGNALKYRSGRGPRVHVSARRDEHGYTFSIADDGVGIDSKYHQSIFGIFKRLHGGEVPGSGIGLALCKRIVDNHGGRIWVESAPQAGATFYFTIPADPPGSTKAAGAE